MDNCQFTIYCDGGVTNNARENSFGGYGYLIMDKDHKYKAWGCRHKAPATNNTMELMAAIYPLSLLFKENVNIKDILIISDSKYVVNSIGTTHNNGWIHDWEQCGYRGGTIKNIEHMEVLYSFMKKSKVSAKWIKGHSGHLFNSIVDNLAGIAKNDKFNFHQEISDRLDLEEFKAAIANNKHVESNRIIRRMIIEPKI
jgi:ribonuclease HI